MTEPAHTLTVGQLAERSGVAVSALHFYEAKGLISSTRTSGNQRRYGRDILRRVAFVRFAQRVGVPLAQIREALASLPEGRTPTRADWARLSANWRSQLDERIIALQRLRDDLSECIGCGCLSLDRCALSNPGDVLAGTGPGPRRLLAGLTGPAPEDGTTADSPPAEAGNPTAEPGTASAEPDTKSAGPASEAGTKSAEPATAGPASETRTATAGPASETRTATAGPAAQDPAGKSGGTCGVPDACTRDGSTDPALARA